ncbi:MAG: CPBP family intramembrane metalloprotease [Planctomycetes bacterium]|jgi:membrane protease YdiL (CAAX protease family)|nr:CPBP family intramembrane metalloprotease [Planctomycetota bacterium]MDA8378972.1 CPBP family intramembrane metalloprotease [Planctomycetia bacterium]
MSKTRKEPQWLRFGTGEGYFDRSHRPLQCLIFMAPLLIIYQIGAVLHPWSPVHGPTHNIIAFELMLNFFSLFGAVGSYLPPMAVVAIMLGWHLARKDPLKFEPGLYVAMGAESFLWAVALVILFLAVDHGLAMQALTHGVTHVMQRLSWQTQVVLSLGAGIYEELLFRLVLITVLNMILVDLFGLSVGKAIPVIIIASAVLFSLYHFLGNEQPTWGAFIIRTMAGIYFAGIFIFRGFGIDVATHAGYDLMVVGLDFLFRHHL